jgi:hypothetical protein
MFPQGTVKKNASTCFILSICLSACPHTTISEVLNQFPLNLILRSSTLCMFQLWLKKDKLITFTWRPTWVLATTSAYLAIYQNENDSKRICRNKWNTPYSKHTWDIFYALGALQLRSPCIWDMMPYHQVINAQVLRAAQFRGSNFKSWRWDNYAVSKHWAPITQWHSSISQMNVVCSYTF